jgi:quinohemoprotein amine dehydrogenase
MSRISDQRKTPEGWEDTIRRMGRTNGVPNSASQAREIIAYLASNQGLASSEAQPIAYALEKRRNVVEDVPNEDVKNVCTRCHSYARIAGERRTREEWFKLKDFHLATFPEELNDPEWPPSADKAVTYLAQHFPLHTPQWEKEKNPAPLGQSTWAVSGHELGRGDYVGTLTITPATDGTYRSDTHLQFADGSQEERQGQGVCYGGYAWRGSTRSSDGERIREVFELSPDRTSARGRWFSEEHPEIGGDEQHDLEAGPPRITAVLPRALKITAAETSLTIAGTHLPTGLAPADLHLGNNIKVVSILQSTSGQVVARVAVLPGAPVGLRDVGIRGAVGQKMLGLYNSPGYIRVLPERGSARIGGVFVPKEAEKFEAVAYSDGPDGIAGTDDDFEIGTIQAQWQIENYYYKYFADDKQFVGSIDQQGLFTPAVETANEQRPATLNNTGSVWVQATYKPPDATQSLEGRAYLLVGATAFMTHEMP